MNVFVLCAGRTASKTFAKAASHIQGFTAGHETRVDKFFDERFAYPYNHIEVDNRLAFFLGALDGKFGDDAYYVHLVRDHSKVAASYRQRWYYEGSIVRAFYSNIMQSVEYDEEAMDNACLFYVKTNDSNIRHFLQNKTHVFVFDVERGSKDFARFVDWLGCKCDKAGYEAWNTLSNRTPTNRLLTRLRAFGGRFLRTIRAMPTVYRDM